MEWNKTLNKCERTHMKKHIYFILLNPGQVQNKLKFIDSLQIMTSTSSYTHQNWFEDWKRQFTQYCGNNLFIPLTSFDCQSFSNVFMKHWTLFIQTPRNRKNQWGKGTVFNVHNTSVIILSLFLSCFFRALSVVRWICDGEWEFVTLTSKKHSGRLPTHLLL